MPLVCMSALAILGPVSFFFSSFLTLVLKVLTLAAEAISSIYFMEAPQRGNVVVGCDCVLG